MFLPLGRKLITFKYKWDFLHHDSDYLTLFLRISHLFLAILNCELLNQNCEIILKDFEFKSELRHKITIVRKYIFYPLRIGFYNLQFLVSLSYLWEKKSELWGKKGRTARCKLAVASKKINKNICVIKGHNLLCLIFFHSGGNGFHRNWLQQWN